MAAANNFEQYLMPLQNSAVKRTLCKTGHTDLQQQWCTSAFKKAARKKEEENVNCELTARKNMTPSILGLATEAHFFHVIVNISHHYHRDPPPLLFSSQLWWWLWRWWLWWWWLYSATIMHETGLDEMTRGIWSRNTLVLHDPCNDNNVEY